ncbi:ScyD/ScyE family protein [Nocardioides sp. GXQ0305]|uniref:ScyD/ScyE family protein n=1 Tax=Nocardioides sp. GXQ0305 TaxID=3423912 RepID=UPI003D7D83E0
MARAHRLGIIALFAAAGLAVTGVQPATAGGGGGSPGEPRVIATGLDNPRGLAFDRRGSLYVAESGTGGAGPCFPGPEGPTVCFGESGGVTKIGRHGQRRVVDGLGSIANEGTGEFAIGPSDVAFAGRKMFVTEGLGLDLDFSNTVPELADMGQLLAVSGKHGVVTVADLAAFEDANNPTGDEENVNPNSMIRGKKGMVVADAGANDLLLVKKNGRVKVLAIFPNRTVGDATFDEVPTSVQRGPDGAWYVGQLTGFPFLPGVANVYRVSASGDVTVAATGFTNIIDIAFDKHGRLYVLEIFANGLLSGDPTGALIRVDDDGSQTEIMSEGLITPGGLTIRGHAAYVSNCGTCAGAGEVLRIPLG